MNPPLDAELIKRAGLRFDAGLSDDEIASIEETYRFSFPPDLKSLLQFGLPVGHDFINWRSDTEEDIRQWLDWPLKGICFDINSNSFWLEEWGVMPVAFDERCEIARLHVSAAPTLIPIFSHRYIPDRPHESGNPIFSVYQTDIILYGADLEDYFRREMTSRLSGEINAKPIEFWTRLVELNNSGPV